MPNSNQPRAIHSAQPEKQIKSIGTDPDGCSLEFAPTKNTRWKFRKDALVVESRIPGLGPPIKTAIGFPGASTNWELRAGTRSQTVTSEESRTKVTVRFFVVSGDRIQFEIHFGQRPAVDSLACHATLAEGVTAATRDDGSLAFVKHGISVLVLSALEAKDAGGERLGASWRVDDNGMIFIDLREADWDGAKYPVVVS